MAFSVQEAISQAYYLSGIVSKGLETIEGYQLQDGLLWFNRVLSTLSTNKDNIPYFKEYHFDSVIGQEEYFIPRLLFTETVTFLLQDHVRFSMQQVPRREYFGSSRINNINSLPFSWHDELTLGGTKIRIYYNPNENYQITLVGKFMLDPVIMTTDLSLTYEPYYIDYLTYLLAEKICNFYSNDMPTPAEKYLKELKNNCVFLSPVDVTYQRSTAFSGNSTYTFADVNIGKGYRPGNS